jgi:cellulose synthase/poly-beta-1,6-N-acetylglucosamine synthase-like glycosyltransferase
MSQQVTVTQTTTREETPLKPRVLVIIPAYNEEDSLGRVIRQAMQRRRSRKGTARPC